jgi:transcriptional regulator with GAF, ATPase, and Fis domain
LITGESGTGKELIARAIHFGSPLAKAAFVPVNCSAIPAELAESAFFGHVRGAFTGAITDHKGYFEQAHKGTLFLDEIGDMPLPAQAKLLRVLEDKVIVPVGAAQEKRVEVRLLAGTNADLQLAITAGKFREDLFFRLARYTIEVPPLRERREDIALLANHFLQLLGAEMGMAHSHFNAEAVAALENHNYPGNVRELRNLVERALIESGGGEIGPEHLQFVRHTHRAQMVAPETPAASQPIPSIPGPVLAKPNHQTDEDRIVAYVRDHGSINNAECRELLQSDMHHSCYVLRKLCAAGLLERTGTGRWTQYHLQERPEAREG